MIRIKEPTSIKKLHFETFYVQHLRIKDRTQALHSLHDGDYPNPAAHSKYDNDHDYLRRRIPNSIRLVTLKLQH